MYVVDDLPSYNRSRELAQISTTQPSQLLQDVFLMIQRVARSTSRKFAQLGLLRRESLFYNVAGINFQVVKYYTFTARKMGRRSAATSGEGEKRGNVGRRYIGRKMSGFRRRCKTLRRGRKRRVQSRAEDSRARARATGSIVICMPNALPFHR